MCLKVTVPSICLPLIIINMGGMDLKFTSLYGTLQLFVSIAVMVLGAHIIMLASIESISSSYLLAGSVAVGAALFLAVANLRKRVL